MKRIIFLITAIILSNIKSFAANYEMCITASGTTNGTITVSLKNNTATSVTVSAMSANISTSPTLTLTEGSGISRTGSRFAKVSNVTLNAGGSTSITVNYTGAVGMTTFSMSNTYEEVDGSANVSVILSGCNTTTLTVLPVELLNFTAENKDKVNILNWQTASEKDNHGFQIERSAEGKQFNSIAFVQGQGTTNEKQNYSFTDNTPHIISYYRLRQIDSDGRETLSKVVSVRIYNAKNKLIVYPNPTSENQISLEVEQNDVDAGDYDNERNRIIVYNAVGQVIFQQKIKENNLLQVDVSTWAKGIYFFKTENDIVKFVKH
jgi:Secretion system C-terminal sorting domain